MPGPAAAAAAAAAAAGSSSKGKSKGSNKARRAASSASCSLQRGGGKSGGAGIKGGGGGCEGDGVGSSGSVGVGSSVIGTGYTSVSHELPPITENQRTLLPRTKSAPLTTRKRRDKRDTSSTSPSVSSSPPSSSSPQQHPSSSDSSFRYSHPPVHPETPLSHDPSSPSSSASSSSSSSSLSSSLHPGSSSSSSPHTDSSTSSSSLHRTVTFCLSSSSSSSSHPTSSSSLLLSGASSPSLSRSPSSSSSSSPCLPPAPPAAPASPCPSLGEQEEEATCAICLELLRRPRLLPCRHTFCLICLQNYVNTCRSLFSCPSCRGEVLVPAAGVAALPDNPRLARTATRLRQLRLTGQALSCGGCGGREGVVTCGHCKVAWCGKCGDTHVLQVQQDIRNLREQLSSARLTLHHTNTNDQEHMRTLEEAIEAAVEERVKRVVEEGRCLTNQVREMKEESETRTEQLGREIESALSTPDQSYGQLTEATQLHATLLRLLKATSTTGGPSVTLDLPSLTLSTTLPSTRRDEDHEEDDHDEEEDEEEEGEEKHLSAHEHSLLYRSKSSLAKARWGQALGERPGGVAVSPWTSEVYVTGSDTCRVYVFDMEGRQVGGFGSRGHGEGQFLCPTGVAFSLVSREIFITDKWKHCVHVLDCEGRFLRQLGRKGRGYGHFLSPEGVATDRHGRIYVADTCNNRVQVLDGDGVFLREIGLVTSETLQDGHRYTKTEFNEPTGVAASLDGSRIYVADSGNHRVKVFDGVTGGRVLSFGIYTGGRLRECRVQVFRPNGNFVRYLGTRKSSHGEFGWVSGLGLSRTWTSLLLTSRTTSSLSSS
ncbi:hypothetical protein Pmani_021593 [Petrolisthes manimaculis]|uniref:RING-type domain-containing protein n=1 Tax=Petrolisthes manimaculis TaxID=1843537 RepID=A0AAE1PEK7_9EUCA|nr:hypothetical protein Pmani_021593 [Petrolisthes manimaculis]